MASNNDPVEEVTKQLQDLCSTTTYPTIPSIPTQANYVALLANLGLPLTLTIHEFILYVSTKLKALEVIMAEIDETLEAEIIASKVEATGAEIEARRADIDRKIKDWNEAIDEY